MAKANKQTKVDEAVQTAVQGQTPVTATMLPKGSVVVADGHVPAELAKQARDMATTAAANYHKEGGERDLKEQLATVKGGDDSLSARALGLGRACFAYAGRDFKAALQLYNGADSVAQTALMQWADEHRKMIGAAKGEKLRLRDVLPTWNSTIPVIRKMLERKLPIDDTNAYPNFTACRSAVRAKPERKDSDGTETPVGERFVSGAPPKMAAALTVLAAELSALPADILNEQAATYIVDVVVPAIRALRPATGHVPAASTKEAPRSQEQAASGTVQAPTAEAQKPVETVKSNKRQTRSRKAA